MLKLKLKNFLTKALLSRFLILCLDLIAVVFSLLSANALRFNFQVPPHVFDSAPYTIFYVLVIRLIPFYFFKTYAGLIKYTGEKDLKNVLTALSISTGFFIFTYGFLRYFQIGDEFYFFYPLSIILIDYVLFQ